MAQNSNVPRSQEDYITQVSEEIEGRVTKKVSQEFSRTENRILGPLARLDDFLMNPLIQGHSGTAPEASRNVCSINQGTNEDDSQSDPHPEAGLPHTQTTRNSDPEDGHGMVIGVHEERPYSHDTVTRAQRGCWEDHDSVHLIIEPVRLLRCAIDVIKQVTLVVCFAMIFRLVPIHIPFDPFQLIRHHLLLKSRVSSRIASMGFGEGNLAGEDFEFLVVRAVIDSYPA